MQSPVNFSATGFFDLNPGWIYPEIQTWVVPTEVCLLKKLEKLPEKNFIHTRGNI